MCLIVGIGLLGFLALCFVSTILTALAKGDFLEAAKWSAVAIVLVGCWLAIRREQSEKKSFLDFLLNNADTLHRGGTVTYKDSSISGRTGITQFYVCVSIIYATYKYPSRYYLSSTQSAGWIYSLIALVCGWWGFPWGPIYTIQSLAKNFQGGEKTTVAQLLAEIAPVTQIPPAPPPATSPQNPRGAAPLPRTPWS